MSLILDALKKLDRDKRSKAPEGVVLLAPTPWPAARSSQTLLALALIVAGLALLTAAALVFLSRAQHTTSVAPADTLNKITASAGTPTSSLPQAPPLSRLKVPVTATPRSVRADLRPSPSIASASPKRMPPPFRLNAIGLYEGQPVAVLNDRLVREGDRFDGITVIRIDDTEVEIEADGKRIQVTF
jgi:hypothetical protein